MLTRRFAVFGALALPAAAMAPRMAEQALAFEPITIRYKPRHYFIPFHNRTQRFACVVAHRRAGKTVACIHDLIKAAVSNTQERSLYAYIAPTYAQAKQVVFDYLVEGVAPLMPYGAKVNLTELKADLPNGSTVRLFGADNYDTLRGLRIDGCVLDEYADFDPRAWTQVIRPALSDRRGFATFIGTPRGHNDFYEIYRNAVRDPEWFSAALKASDLVPLNDLDPEARTHNLLTSDELEDTKKQISEEWYRQEFECDFEAANPGAYYGRQMEEAQKTGRIGPYPWDPNYQVYTAWDIGGDRDATAIWFWQMQGKAIYLIDYIENTGADSAPHAKALLKRPYSYAQHFLPHDAGPNRTGIDKSFADFLRDHGLRGITVLPVGVREHGINAVRLLLSRCHFDVRACELGIEALKMYQTEWDEKNKVFKSTPKHDWASHGADAFRYLAAALDKHISAPNFNRKLNYPKGF